MGIQGKMYPCDKCTREYLIYDGMEEYWPCACGGKAYRIPPDKPGSANDRQFDTGAIRSSDADHLDFCSLPIVGLIALAKVAGVGGMKYGRFNYTLGMPAHVCVNHAIRHLLMWTSGDRSECHLSRAAWNCLVALQSLILDPKLNAPHLLGPGATVTPAVKAILDAGADGRAADRAAGKFKEAEAWVTAELPEIAKIISQREGT